MFSGTHTLFLILGESGHDHRESACILRDDHMLPTSGKNELLELTLEIERWTLITREELEQSMGIPWRFYKKAGHYIYTYSTPLTSVNLLRTGCGFSALSNILVKISLLDCSLHANHLCCELLEILSIDIITVNHANSTSHVLTVCSKAKKWVCCIIAYITSVCLYYIERTRVCVATARVPIFVMSVW